MPVMKFDHATGLSGGTEVSSGANWPERSMRAMLGSLPSSMSWRVSP